LENIIELHKILGMSLLTEQLVASQKGLYSMQKDARAHAAFTECIHLVAYELRGHCREMLM
jgi:hypothetical protein